MNVIFLDFDGVLNTVHDKNDENDENLEKRIAILSDICKEFDCKVVIEASMKDAIDEETMETTSNWINKVFDLFKKYNIDCIGRVPNVSRKLSVSYTSIWKEDEIRLYLFRHPEIEHYCVIDDDDLYPYSDLDKVRNHLVQTIYYSDNPQEEGLTEDYKSEIGKVLQKKNEMQKIALRKANKKK